MSIKCVGGTVNQQISDITECSICIDVFKDPRVLPCVHTFCLRCLEIFTKKQKPESLIPCPLCRVPFSIPKGGLKDMPKNPLAQKLIDMNSGASQNVDVMSVTNESLNEVISRKTVQLQQFRNQLALNLDQLPKQIVSVECEIRQQQDFLKQLVDESANELFDQLKHIHQKSQSDLQREIEDIEDKLSRLNALRCGSAANLKSQSSGGRNVEFRNIIAELRRIEDNVNCVNIVLLPNNPSKDRKEITIGRIEVSSSSTSETASCDKQEFEPRLIKTVVSDDNGVVGLSVIDDLVYIVRSWSSKIEVFSSSLSMAQRQISVPDLDLPNDMDGCIRNKCLYLTDYSSDVHRIEVGIGGFHSKWSAGAGPLALSVFQPTASVLVTFQTAHKVKEFSTHGVLLREICLSSELPSPHHSLLLADDIMLVCHGFESDYANDLCLVDTRTGSVLKSTDSSTDRLAQPVRMAIDQRRSLIFVADIKDDRVVVFDMSSLARLTVMQGVGRRPHGLFMDRDRGYLYVGSWETSQISIFDVTFGR